MTGASKLKILSWLKKDDLRSIGEFGLIERIAQKTRIDKKRVVLGIGDDAAVIKNHTGYWSALTCDMLIEGVHFQPEASPFQIGWKALAVNLSDLAAMGARPIAALVSVAMPSKTKVDFADELYRGIRSLATKFQVNIIGGNTSISPEKLIVDIFLLGEVKPKYLTRRDGAKIGDKILVTGNLGGASVGLEILKRKRKIPQRYQTQLLRRQFEPHPRLKEAEYLVKNFKINAMIDLSDGLIGDLKHILKRSRVGAKIFKKAVPISLSVKKVARILNLDPWILATQRGEDYELLFTVSAREARRLLAKKLNFPLTLIGEIVPVKEGESFKAKGYTHF